MENEKKKSKVMIALLALIIILLAVGVGISIGLNAFNKGTEIKEPETTKSQSQTKTNTIENKVKNTVTNTTANTVSNTIVNNVVENSVIENKTVETITNADAILTGEFTQDVAVKIAKEFIEAVNKNDQVTVNKYCKNYYNLVSKYGIKNLTVDYNNVRYIKSQYAEYIFDCDYNSDVARKEVSLGSMFIVAITDTNKIEITVGATGP